MVSPHISGLTTIDGAAHGFLECLESLERGELPKWVVDRTRGLLPGLPRLVQMGVAYRL